MVAVKHFVLFLWIFLLPPDGTHGEHKVDTIIREVGEMDKYFSTDLHRFIGGKNISLFFPDMTFGDWNLKLDVNVGKGYRGPVVNDERKKLQGIFQSLNDSTLITRASDGHGRTCNVSIKGDQLVRNYVRYYRQLKEKMVSDTGMMTLGFDYGGVNVTLGIMKGIDVDEEGTIKYLPYEIQDLQDVFGFTVPGFEIPTLFTKYEVTVDGDCLPDYEFLNKTYWINGSVSSREAWSQMAHSCSQMITLLTNIPCFDMVKDLQAPIDQFFMVAMGLQTMFFHMFSEQEGLRLTHRVCTVNSHDFVELMSERQYGVNQCCTLQKEHSLPYELDITKKWYCYNPYHLSNILTTMSKVVSLVIVMLFPLTIKWLPAIHAKGEKQIKTENASSNIGTSLLPHKDGKQELVSVTTESKSDATTEMLQHDTNKDVNTVWMFLDDDSGYHFSFKVILWHLLLFDKVNRGMMMLRRLLFLYMITLLTHLATLQIHLYYQDLYERTWQFYFTTFLYFIWNIKDARHEKYHFDMMITFSIFVIPFAMAVIQFLLLSPIFLRKEPIAQILYWSEKDTAIGKYVGQKVQKRNQDVRHQPYEIKLFLNVEARLSYLTCSKFWKYLFTQSIFETNTDKNNTCTRVAKFFIRILLIPLMIPFYTFPILSVFWVIFCGGGGFNFVKKRRCKTFFMRLVVGLGVAYFTSVLLACLTMYVHMTMFIMIDVIRTLTSTLTHVIFLISAIVNIKETFRNIEDRYREMKLMIFTILEDMSSSSSEEDQRVSWCMLKSFDKSTVAIPRSLFIQVCKEHMPYGRLVTIALVLLLLRLAFLGLLYMIIVDYQIFAQLSETGEGLITIIFVSLPSLLSKNKSDAEKGLEDKHMSLKVKSTIINVSSEAMEACSTDQANREFDV